MEFRIVTDGKFFKVQERRVLFWTDVSSPYIGRYTRRHMQRVKWNTIEEARTVLRRKQAAEERKAQRKAKVWTVVKMEEMNV